MKKGERAILKCTAPYAYGQSGSPPKIPPNATLNFEVELLDFFDKEKTKWDYTPEERSKLAIDFKGEGNEYFKKGDLNNALKKYKDALDYAEHGGEGPLIDDLRVNCYSNLAAVYTK